MIARTLSRMAVICVVFGAAERGVSSPQSYSYLVTDLGVLGGPMSAGTALNDAGQAVGYSAIASANFHGALFDGTPVDLGTLPGDSQSTAHAINNGGQIIGVSYDLGDLQNHAVLWNGGLPLSLGDFLPRDVNTTGTIAGYLTGFSEDLWVDRACQWSSGMLTDLGTLGGRSSQAFAIDNAGRIVGKSYLADNLTFRACLWLKGSPRDLGTLAGTATANSAAADMNDSGQVVGWSETASGIPHAFRVLVDAGGNVLLRMDLGGLGGAFSYALGINDAGEVVGTSDSCAVLWRGAQIFDLCGQIPQGSGWDLLRANAINSARQIVGEGLHTGFPRAFLLTPVSCTKGDVNGDGTVDGLDVQGFLDAVAGSGTPVQVCAGDVGPVADGMVSDDDVENFTLCLIGLNGCQ